MNKIFIFMGIIFGCNSFAQVPVKNPSCANKINLHHPQGSGGVFFDADCKVAYVLPPSVSDVAVTQLVGTANIRQCEVVNRILAMQETTAEHMESLMDEQQSALPPASYGGAITEIINGNGNSTKAPTDDLGKRIELLRQYSELSRSFQQIMDSYKDIPAASAVMQFRIPWDELVNKYQQQNPSASLTFVRMPLDATYLTFNRQISKIGSLPAVLDYDIPGVGALNSGLNDSTVAVGGSQTSLLIGDAYSGQIILSLAGACPFYNSALKTVSGAISSSAVSAYLNANLNYSYGLQVYRKYTVSYDLALLAKHIQERATHGGFFSTSTSVSEVNSMENTDWFVLKNESNDARFSYELLVPEVKADLMNRVIRDITMMSGFKLEDAPQITPRTKNGAQAAADALGKCPDWRCQVAGMSLTVLDSIFGSSSAVSTYINEKHARAGDKVDDIKVLRFYGSSVFNTQSKW